MTKLWLLLLVTHALAACDSPQPAPGVPSSAATTVGPGEPDHPPSRPVGEATLAQHLAGATRIRILNVWHADAGPAMAATLVTDHDLIADIKEAIDFEQKPVAEDGACEPCRTRYRLVFESPLGLDLGSVDFGCPATPDTRGRYWQPASNGCGIITISVIYKLRKLIEKAETQG